MKNLKIVKEYDRGVEVYVVKKRFLWIFWDFVAKFHVRAWAEEFIAQIEASKTKGC